MTKLAHLQYWTQRKETHEAAYGCAKYLYNDKEYDDMIEVLLGNYECDSELAWESIVRVYFEGTVHIYAAACIACCTPEEIELDIQNTAKELYKRSNQ